MGVTFDPDFERIGNAGSYDAFYGLFKRQRRFAESVLKELASHLMDSFIKEVGTTVSTCVNVSETRNLRETCHQPLGAHISSNSNDSILEIR
jgi:hypothetical protein